MELNKLPREEAWLEKRKCLLENHWGIVILSNPEDGEGQAKETEKHSPARKKGNQELTVSWELKEYISRRKWSTVSNAAQRSSQMRTENGPLDLQCESLFGGLGGGDTKERWTAVRARTGKEDIECRQLFCILLLRGTEKCAVPRRGLWGQERHFKMEERTACSSFFCFFFLRFYVFTWHRERGESEQAWPGEQQARGEASSPLSKEP